MIHVIIGTKAQLIKMAPILKQMQDQGIAYNYILTGQHKDTVTDIANNFNLKQPDYILYSGTDITSIVKMGIWFTKCMIKTIFNKKQIFKQDKNGIVLVHGDTFSTLLGAMMGKIAGLKVGHVESGLRSFNLFHPFPEELTRILVFRLSNYMFCPGEWAVKNVQRYKAKKINTQFNTLYDALMQVIPKLKAINVDVPGYNYAIVSIHRFENIYNQAALERIVSTVQDIAKNKRLLFILHKPTEKKLYQFNMYQSLAQNPQIELRQRYDYFKFIKLVYHADFIISDGGSNQEECYFLGKPILLLRKATERNEGIGHNCVLSEYKPQVIADFVQHSQQYQNDFQSLSPSPTDIIIENIKVYA
ncbi:UDP-N-acetylglucosamine 2-epimerase [Candidatus Albibeggiatoa sp. nov. NOAA]|uniref:UDP-N-acetylglucosamine 2-epimerase n=1 Tax=Candidatus Albibeggiatoa sp. nov. NOAA TaxID=3162724 RepID=UPI0032F5AE32|nr:UDP-N-acetylglucosamine 2-epimerase [Thiotrichaceae bacterium]